jgi:hypothetical protein
LKLPESVLRPQRSKDEHEPEDDHAGRQTNHTIFVLALVVLHEIRLREASEFWGYLQSLPRDVDLPLFWPEESDEKLWLQGTEAGRDLLRKEKEGMGLVSASASDHPDRL